MLEVLTSNLVGRIIGLNPISVPIFKTFYYMVLGAAMDNLARRRRQDILLYKIIYSS